MDKVLLSKNSDHWKTPTNLYYRFINHGYFDPCPYHSDFDGLNIEWKDFNFVNPPYSKLKDWVIKSIEEHKKHKCVVLLIPARTDTKAFKILFNYGCIFSFITGRLKFNDLGSAPFPSVMVTLIGSNFKSQMLLIDRDEL